MMTLRVLLVEDNEADAFFFRELTRDIAHLPLTLEVAKDLKSAIELCDSEHFDVIFLDLGLPDSLGIETFDQLKSRVRTTPIVVFTGSTATDGGVAAVQRGAQDYLVKGSVSAELLSKTMLYAIARFKHEIVKLELDQARIEIATVATAKSQFLSNVSHELATPLTAALGYLQLLNGSSTIGELDRDKVIKALEAGRVLQNVVSNVIEAARVDMQDILLSQDSLSINAELKQLTDNFQAQCIAKSIVFTGACSGPDLVALDQSKLRFICNALVKNAVQFTDNGSVSVSIEHDDERLVLEVVDTGRGVEPALHDRLFESFQHNLDYLRTAGHGAGLSLYICKSYVDAMDGSMTIESDGIRGSKFTVTIPVKGINQGRQGVAIYPGFATGVV